MLSVFRERFDELSGPEFAVPELLTGTKQREGESTAAFETRFRTAAVRVGRASPGLVTDKLLLHIFCANVTSEYRKRLLDKNPKTFTEALTEFRWYGRFIKGEISKPKLPGVFAVGAWHENTKNKTEKTKGEVQSADSDKNKSGRFSSAPPQKKSGRDKGTFRDNCYNCSEEGHLARDCPYPKKETREQRNRKPQSNKFGQKHNSKKQRDVFSSDPSNFQRMMLPFAQNLLTVPSFPVFQAPQVPPFMTSATQSPWSFAATMGAPQIMGPSGAAGSFAHPGWNGGGGWCLPQQAPMTGGWSQLSLFPPQVQHSALVPETQRLPLPPATVGRTEAKSDTEPKGQQARVRKVSARFPRLYIVKCEAQLGGTRIPVLIDTCAPCCLIDSELLDTLEARGHARKTSYREYSDALTLVGISGQKLHIREEMEVDVELGGAKVTRNFIPVHDFADKLLLATDFCDDVDANVSFGKREVQLPKLGVSLPMMGYWRRVKGRLPKAVVFCKENTVIPPCSEMPITVVHLGSNPLSYVTREAYVCERAEAVRPSSLRVCPGIVRFDRGVGTIVVANFGDEPIRLDRESAVADVLPVEGREKDLELAKGKTMGVFRVQHVEQEFDLESNTVPTLASLAIKQKGLPIQEPKADGEASFQSF